MSGSKIAFTGLPRQYNNLKEEILDVTDSVLRTGQLMSGAWTHEFEDWLANRTHSRGAVTCHSGTHALEIIAGYYADQTVINPPRVLIPSMTYAATANAFMRAGWDVHFCDVDRNGILKPSSIPSGVHFHAVVLIGLYGASVDNLVRSDYWPIHAVANDVAWIEDAAQHWLSNNSARVGHASAISFDPMKNLGNYGNGGAIVTHDANLIEYARAWRDNGKVNHQQIGTNSRMSEVECAQMMIKTKYIDQWQERRRTIATYWVERLKKSNARSLIDDDNIDNHCFHKFVIEVDNRDSLKETLALNNIETRVHYEKPLHEMGVFRQCPGPDSMFSPASALCRRVLSLPIYPELTDSEVERIISQVLNYV